MEKPVILIIDEVDQAGNQQIFRNYQGYAAGDLDAMNTYMNRVALATFSYFDTGKSPSEEAEPERFPTGKAFTKNLEEPNSSTCFFHGFVLGLMVDLGNRYRITSNRESGFGRYDVMVISTRQLTDAEKKTAIAQSENKFRQMSGFLGELQTKYRRAQDIRFFDEVMEEWS